MAKKKTAADEKRIAVAVSMINDENISYSDLLSKHGLKKGDIAQKTLDNYRRLIKNLFDDILDTEREKGNEEELLKDADIHGKAYEGLKYKIELYAKAKKPVPILFVGDTGTGKELCARYYMKHSPRLGNKRTVNCAAFTDELLASEIFGHVKGAYSGAYCDRDGLLKTCRDGILFLDEIGDASKTFQAAILRVANGDSYRRVGDDAEQIEPNVLIIAATNKAHELRDDLKFRFQIVYVPPLQKDDIDELSEHFLGRPLNGKYLDYLLGHDYPGNVRELKSKCEELRTMYSEEIFSDQSLPLCHSWNFDYERYIREIEIWDRFYQSLFDRYGIKEFGYKYQDSPDEIGCYVNSLNAHRRQSAFADEAKLILGMLGSASDPGLFKLALDPESRYYIDKKGDMVERLTAEKREEIIRWFTLDLRRVIENQNLPLLLSVVASEYRVATLRKVKQKKPSTSHLFDLPGEIALEKFELMLIEYALKQFNGDKSLAADKMGYNGERKADSLHNRLQHLMGKCSEDPKG